MAGMIPVYGVGKHQVEEVVPLPEFSENVVSWLFTAALSSRVCAHPGSILREKTTLNIISLKFHDCSLLLSLVSPKSALPLHQTARRPLNR